MATHDYVIDNSTGANVRADLNLVLQAILTNNSSSSAPSTTAAYMWWADTSAGILKIRNSADNAWVELLQLDGTLTLEDGSASTPALAFRDDLNTGIYSRTTDSFNVSAGGVDRLEIGTQTVFNDGGADIDFRIEGDTDANLFYVDASTDRIGIGQSVPEGKLHLETGSSGASYSADNSDVLIIEHSDSVGIDLRSPAANSGNILFSDANARGQGRISYGHNDDGMFFCTGGIGNERMRIDSSGRLLIGSTSNRSHGGIEAHLQVLGTGTDDSSITMSRFSNDVHSAYIVFAKSRGGSIGTDTVVQSGDSLGRMTFFGNDGTDGNTPAAEIDIEVDGTPGSNDMPGRIVFRTTADGASSTTERMRIDSSGFVGINATSPQSILHVQNGSLANGTIFVGANYDGSALNNNSDKSGAIHAPMYDSDTFPKGVRLMAHYSSNSVTLLQLGGGTNSARSATDILFYTAANKSANGGEKMRIDLNGHVLFNCTALPSTSVAGAGFEKNGSNSVFFSSNGSATSSINVAEFVNGNGVIGRISTSGSATTFHTSSDYRLKENQVAISDGITRLKSLKPYRFNFKADSTKTVDGFFAHEVSPVVPEAIWGEKDAVKEDGSIDPQGIDQSKIVPLLVAAVQELITKVETLEAA